MAFARCDESIFISLNDSVGGTDTEVQSEWKLLEEQFSWEQMILQQFPEVKDGYPHSDSTYPQIWNLDWNIAVHRERNIVVNKQHF